MKKILQHICIWLFIIMLIAISIKTKNVGAACTYDSDCPSGNCVLDYDGDPKICTTANKCQHNSVEYNVGDTSSSFICLDCKDNTARWVYNSDGRFIVKDSTNNEKLILDKAGQLLTAGGITYGSSVTTDGNDWQVKFGTDVVARLDETGDFYLEGSLDEQDTSIGQTSLGELLWKYDAGGYFVAVITESGDMDIRGQYGESCDFSIY